jgi:hypothetical protein
MVKACYIEQMNPMASVLKYMFRYIGRICNQAVLGTEQICVCQSIEAEIKLTFQNRLHAAEFGANVDFPHPLTPMTAT